MPDDDLVGEEPFEPVQEKVETYGAETPVTGQTKMQANKNKPRMPQGKHNICFFGGWGVGAGPLRAQGPRATKN